MSWPASRQSLANAFAEGDYWMLRSKRVLQELITDSVAGPVKRGEILKIKKRLEDLDVQLTKTIGYGADAVAYARTEYRDPALDVAGEYIAVRDAARALAIWIGTAMPDGTDITEYDAATGDSIDLMFATAALTDFRTNAGVFIATVG